MSRFADVTLIDVNGNPLTVESTGGDTSLAVVPGHHVMNVVHLDTGAIAATEGFMLVDLSDTTDWPHTEVGNIDLCWVHGAIDPDAAFVGTLVIGYLLDVGAADGDFHHILGVSFVRKSDIWVANFDFGGDFGHVGCVDGGVYGETDGGDVTWRTAGADITGPAGDTHPCGNGDLVAKLTVSAGNVSGSFTIGYHAVA